MTGSPVFILFLIHLPFRHNFRSSQVGLRYANPTYGLIEERKKKGLWIPDRGRG